MTVTFCKKCGHNVKSPHECPNQDNFLYDLFKAVTARMNKLNSMADNPSFDDHERETFQCMSDEMTKVHIAIKSKDVKGLIKVFH